MINGAEGFRDWDQRWDVLVIGGGNAALVSALSAQEHGARVLVLERSAPELRGGNSRHTRNIRCLHEGPDEFYTGGYPFEELWRDLCGVGTGPSNEELAEQTVRESESVPGWMSDRGVRWQHPLTGTLHLGRTNRFFLGGGKALLNGYYRVLESRGIPVAYGACVEELLLEDDRCVGAVVDVAGARVRVRAAAVVCASGGFEGNLEWLGRYWGDAARNYHIRGPQWNDGTVLRQLYEHGAASAGQERGFHAVAVDARSPRFDGGIATRLDTIPFGIVVNRSGRRFYDEGEDAWPKRYAIWGRNIAGQDDQLAFSLWDSKVATLFLPPLYGAFQAPTIAGIADALGLSVDALVRTVEEYNRAAPEHAEAAFDPSGLDGVATRGLDPPKSNWAQRLDAPPFFGVPMRPGVTFTYMGVKVDRTARVHRTDGSQFANVYAAGEIMSGNILSTGYLAGFGMTIGTVWGRIAGREAALNGRG